MNFLPLRVAILTVLYKATDWSGRATRSEFWWWFLFQYMVIIAVILSVLAVDFWSIVPGISADTYFFALQIWTLVTLLPNLSVTIRRLRDAGSSTKFAFLGLSNVHVFLLTPWLIKPSLPKNSYRAAGPEPKKRLKKRWRIVYFLVAAFFISLIAQGL